MTLPARYYTDPEIFRKELERFYFNRWICAGRESSIPNPGDYFLCELAGESVIVTRDTSGDVRAFYNVCRHRGSRMCTEQHGSLPGRRITCPYHAWSYGLDGALLGAPHAERPGFSRADYPLKSVHTEIWEGNVFLHFGTPRAIGRGNVRDRRAKIRELAHGGAAHSTAASSTTSRPTGS